MTTQTTINEVQRDRLVTSLDVLLPRVEAITEEFCILLEMADDSLRLQLPSDARMIEPVIGQLLNAVSDDVLADSLASELATNATEAAVLPEHAPTLLASLQTAIAETAGYTWTDRLEQAWFRWFDALLEIALEHARRDQSLAA